MNKIKAFFAGLGALMISYLIIAVLLFFFTVIMVILGANPNGGFDMLLAVFKLPLYVSTICFLIILYSVSYFCKSRKKISNFLNSLY
jgi:hypothetical protein